MRQRFGPRTLFLLSLFLAWGGAVAATAQVPPVLFSSDFETGGLCSWSDAVPPAEITRVEPAEGSVGTRLTIEGRALGDRQHRILLSGGVPWGSVEAELDIEDRKPGQLLARIRQPLALGRYDVVLEGCHGTRLVPEAFEMRLPSGIALMPRFVEPGADVVMTGSFFGTQPGSLFVKDPAGGGLGATVLSWEDTRVVFRMPTALVSNGPRDLQITNALGTITVPNALVVVGVDDGDETGPRLVSAVATSNTQVTVQFSEAVRGGSDGAENPSFYRITGPPLARIPTVTVLSATVVGPGFSRVILETISQSDLLYTLQVAGIEDLAGNPIAPPDILVDPSKTTFYGVPPGGGTPIDSDGDGLSDAAEQNGWIVTVQRIDGGESVSHVTSDPGDPRLPVSDPVNVAARDTDGDGVEDAEELNASMNPRSGDTDGDTLSDDLEWNTIYSSPIDQDSDGDGIQDGVEFVLFRTSPLLADTDGDQLLDPDEAFSGNRDPLLSDLPSPRIRVGGVNLALDTRFTYTDETGQRVSESKTSESTLTRGQNETFSTSNENSTVSTLEFSQEISGGYDFPGGSVSATAGSSQGSERGNTFTVGEESARSTEEAFHESLTTEAERDIRESVTREIEGASVKVDVSIENLGDVPFTISNLELTAQTQDPNDRRRVVPIASLVPENPELDEVNIGALGDPSRGPFVFTAVSVFPQQVQELMKSPRGLIVQLANFDITDENGRNFAFSSQEVLDRTAGISFDLGDGRVESYRVATASAHDRATGKPLGITMGYALQEIIGLRDRPTIRDGGNGWVETTAQGDDVQEQTVGTSVEPGVVIVSVGPNGTLDTTASGDDLEVESDYATALRLGEPKIRDGGNRIADTTALGDDEQAVPVGQTVKRGQVIVTPGANGTFDTVPQGDDRIVQPPPPHRVLSRFREVEAEAATKRFWSLYVTRPVPLPPAVHLEDIVLRAGEQYDFAYVQDKDDDRVWAREEFLHGSSDLLANSDNCSLLPPDNCDELDDREEIQVGWRVQVKGTPEGYNVYPNPVQGDSDRDRLVDHRERTCRLDPRQRDTDLDGLTDWEELNGVLIVQGVEYPMVSRDPDNGAVVLTVTPYAGTGATGQVPHDVIVGCNTLGFATDPLDPDTDGDLVDDGLELQLGLDPNNPSDGPLFLDDDGDGVPNLLEDQGFLTEINGVQTRVYSGKDDPDSDDDGLPDLLEHYLRSNPQSVDTDGDGIRDGNEYGSADTCTTPTATQSNPCTFFADKTEQNHDDFLLACAEADVCNFDDASYASNPGTNLNRRDSDLDGVNDPVELDEFVLAVNGANVTLPAPPGASDPVDADTDNDGLPDGEELTAGSDGFITNPRLGDTDGDGRTDATEITAGTDPAFRDKKVTVTSASINVTLSDDEGAGNNADMRWAARIKVGGGSYGSDVCSYSATVDEGTYTKVCTYFSRVIRDEGSSVVTIESSGFEEDDSSQDEICNTIEEAFTYANSLDSTTRSLSHTCGGDLDFNITLTVEVE